MKLLENMELGFYEFDTANKRSGLWDKWVRVSLKMNGLEYDITPYIIKAYGFETSRRGSKKHNKFIVNYACMGFFLRDYVKDAIKRDKKPLMELISKAFEQDELFPFKFTHDGEILWDSMKLEN